MTARIFVEPLGSAGKRGIIIRGVIRGWRKDPVWSSTHDYSTQKKCFSWKMLFMEDAVRFMIGQQWRNVYTARKKMRDIYV
jgi:hypothetical protein